jgi:hypothetical protein
MRYTYIEIEEAKRQDDIASPFSLMQSYMYSAFEKKLGIHVH